MVAPKFIRGRRTDRRVVKKNMAQGHTYTKSTFNDTIMSITGPKGIVILQVLSDYVGFKGSRKSTPLVAQVAVRNAARKAMDHGMKKVDVLAEGSGSGRETAIHSLQAAGLEVFSVSGVTPQPYNGCRPLKHRRVQEQGKERTEMVRYTGPVTRKSRRFRVDLVGGDVDFGRRPYPPGQAGHTRIKESEYLLQLQEKQKVRFTCGVAEKQSRRYYAEAHHCPGKTGDSLVVLLESRLDSVVYRAGPTRARRQTRQLVPHGYLIINDKRINVSSFQVSQYDIIDVCPESREMIQFEEAQEGPIDTVAPTWLQVVPESLRILMHQTLERAQIGIPPQEQLIVEFYSR